MVDNPIPVRARIRLLPREEGGRATPIVGGTSYRPNHNFMSDQNVEMGMGAIDLPPGFLLQPGESVEVEMTLYPWPLDTDISPGREWRIQEGGRLVGIGTVLDILSD
ncbi:MAG TPA: hypothetical protein VEZ20_10065 [Allosphingosinicella sp.]|nr:hypothetical protein [Allosphingosinicella sp.]